MCILDCFSKINDFSFSVPTSVMYKCKTSKVLRLIGWPLLLFSNKSGVLVMTLEVIRV